jgi:hypothetical protein
VERIDLGIKWQRYPLCYEYSVTQILHYLNDEFDKEAQAKAMEEKYYDVEGSKYYKMPAQAIIRSWDLKRDRAIDLGHSLDDWAEAIIDPGDEEHGMTRERWQSRHGGEADKMNIVRAWTKYWHDLENLGYKLVAREQHMHKYYAGHVVSGKADIILYYPPSNTIVIIDWKTTDKLVSSVKRTCLIHGPEWTKGLPQEKLTHSAIQCNVYRDMLEDILPDEPHYNISTAIVNVKKDGSVMTYHEPLIYDKNQTNELMEWGVSMKIAHPEWERDMKS